MKYIFDDFCSSVKKPTKQNQEKNAELSFVERSKISDTLIEAFSLIASQRSIEC